VVSVVEPGPSFARFFGFWMRSVATEFNRPYASCLVLFGLALAFFSIGVGEITSPTSKDEYHRVFRTALQMVEQKVWWIPTLDGAPRLEKPPLLAWLTRLSFELFGIGLKSARIIIVLFSALFVAVVALIAHELRQDRGTALLAGMIALSTVPIGIHGRILLPDIPTAVFSASGFYFFLKWMKTNRKGCLLATAFCLSAGFLTKGPIVGVVFGSGLIALLIRPDVRNSIMLLNWPILVLSTTLFLFLTIPWFLDACGKSPAQTLSVLESEVDARRLGRFNLNPVLQLVPLSMPWTFYVISAVIRTKATVEAESREFKLFLIAWLVLSVLPFFFIRSFDRYLVGSLVPLALLTAAGIPSMTPRGYMLAGRIGATLVSIAVPPFLFFFGWFYGSRPELYIALVAYFVFLITWWMGVRPLQMAVAAAALWTVSVGLIYPSLGVNDFPGRILDRIAGKDVLFYVDVQPALLPIVAGHSFKLEKDAVQLGQQCHTSPLVFALDQHATKLEGSLALRGIQFTRVDTFKSLIALHKALRPARWAGEDWRRAFRGRTIDPLKSTIVLYQLSCRHLPAPL